MPLKMWRLNRPAGDTIPVSYAVLVQLVERHVANVKATSSSLVYRSSVRRFEIMHNHEKSFCQL